MRLRTVGPSTQWQRREEISFRYEFNWFVSLQQQLLRWMMPRENCLFTSEIMRATISMQHNTANKM